MINLSAIRALPLSVFILLVLARSAVAVRVAPVFNGRLYGGQYFFEDQESRLSGNAGITAAPAVSFNEYWSLIPTLSASWRGTKSVKDLVGGGTLFQETQEHGASVKGIFAPTKPLQIKLAAGYRLQLLKETQDENWDKGLFDFQRTNANVEVERSFGQNTSIRIGYDFYYVDFRNFSSLESQKRELGRENASAKTLNTMNHASYTAGKIPFPFLFEQTGRLEVSYFYTIRNFSEQHIVELSGELSGDLRTDSNHIFRTEFIFPFAFAETFKLLVEMKGGLNDLYSNGNNYDARLTRFNPNYYAYREYSGGSNLNFIVGRRPMIFTGGFDYTRRNYIERPVQNAGGTYVSKTEAGAEPGSGRIHINEYYVNFGITYPLTKNFRMQALGNLGWSRSNMKYEKTYRYNYVSSSYLLGVVYEY